MSMLSFRANYLGSAYVFATVPKSFNEKARKKLCNTSTRPPLHHHIKTSTSLVRLQLPPASVSMLNQKVRTYTRTDETSIETLASSLASAFEHDPLFCYIQGSNEDTFSRNKLLMMSTLNIELSLPDGHSTVHVSEDDGTVAVWRHMNHWRTPLSLEILFAFTLFRALGWGAIRFIDAVRRVEEAHPDEPHMHLFIMGTQEATRGRGIGSMVISKMLDYCDHNGIPAYLESSNEKNLSFYRKHGFEVLRRIPDLPDGCPPIYALWRDPKPVSDMQSLNNSI